MSTTGTTTNTTPMSELEKYDRAVYTYLATISSRIVYSPTSTAVRTITKREAFSDKKPWNFISYHRNPTFEVDWSRMNNFSTITGGLNKVTTATGGSKTARYIQNIPVNLTYDVDIWASKEIEVQNLAIGLITKIYMTDQVLEVPIAADLETTRFHILDVNWTDNSDLERETEIGRIYRHTITFSLDARITLVRDVPTTTLAEVPINIYEGGE